MSLRPARRILLALVAGITLATPGDAAGQGTVVDQGEFRILHRGREAGSETFTILQSGTGAEIRWTAEGVVSRDSDVGRTELATTLASRGRLAAPTGYQGKLSGARQEDVTYRMEGSRVMVQLTSPEGSEMREIRADPNVLVVDEGVAHHFHFVVLRFLEGSPRIDILRPRTRATLSVEIEERDPTSVRLRGESVPVRRIRLTSGTEMWEVWFDLRGRVMRVEIPSGSLRYERVR